MIFLAMVMKSRRQSVIGEIVGREQITSQEQLRTRLKARGYTVTQATLSRDIRDLGLVKRSSDGAYQLPGAEPAARAQPQQRGDAHRYAASSLRNRTTRSCIALRASSGPTIHA